MRLLYIAHGIPVPGTLGGSTHAYEVARGLAQRGHSLHLVAASREGWGGVAPFARPVSRMFDGFHLHHQDIPKQLGVLGVGVVARLARAVRPDAIIERYYNFSGAGVWAAHRLGIPCLLEVNALIVDPPQVFKRRLDDTLGAPMQRWARAQCRLARRIVTPLHTTIPPEIPRSSIVELPWGANVERFALPPCPSQPPVVLFLGSFRAWHGVTDFVRAGVMLLEQGRNVRFVLVGDGPERARAEALAATWRERFTFLGRIPYEEVPGVLCGASVGVAPFTTTPHPALRAAGFFWSPLKLYEYMAAGLPVVTTNLHPLNTVIREGHEGALFEENDVAGLAAAMGRLLANAEEARAMGQRGRARVVARYSWQQHCASLEQIIQEMVAEAGQ